MKLKRKDCPVCLGTKFKMLEDYIRVALAECSECGSVFVPFVPSESELVEHYRKYERNHESNPAVSQNRRLEVLASFEPYRTEGNLLDVGCGVGHFLDQALASGWRTFGVELDSEAVEICSANGHSIHHGKLPSAPFEHHQFDVAIYSEVVEHINNQPEEFARIFELIRPGGLLFITTPNFNSVSRQVLGERWDVISYPEHLVYFSPSTLSAAVENAGFKPIAIVTTGVSPGRLVNSLAGKGRQRRVAIDTSVRNATENNRLGKVFKRSVNLLLKRYEVGDTIQARFLRP